jgi:ubiquinone/menaquinone biosynthesis C-methylase UbiE
MQSENAKVWDGERLEANVYDDNAIEHLHRYAIAMSLIQEKNVLDLASGEGYGSNLMASVAKSVTGVDISEEAIQYASKKYQRSNLKFLEGSADNIPVETDSIDVVVSFETIEHHNKHEEMMSEIKRVLKKNGLLVISSPDKLNYSDIPETQNPYHVKELYLEEFRALIERYFKYNVMLLQKIVYGSLVAPEQGSSNLRSFTGGYDSIASFQGVQSPVYNICIASDIQLEEFEISFFDGKEALERLVNYKRMESMMLVRSSKTYKVGQLLMSPFKVFRNILR